MSRTANIIGWNNGGGLSRDIEILRQILGEFGWTIAVNATRASHARRSLPMRALGRTHRRALEIAVRRGLVAPPFEINLHLEDINGEHIPLAKRNILIPNQEWLRDTSRRHLSAIDEVWAKTYFAKELFAKLGCNVRYLGWMGNDRRITGQAPSRPIKVLHIAGSSLWKGTEALLDVWYENPSWPVLTVLRRDHGYGGEPLTWRTRPPRANVTIIGDRVDDELLKTLQNEASIHICPSEAEGFGHNILESMSVAAVTVTTDAPPMNEMITPKTGILVPAERCQPMGIGMRYFVSHTDLARAITTALNMENRERQSMGAAARVRFEQNNLAFRARIHDCLACGRPKTPPAE